MVGRPGTNDKGAPLSELSLNRNEQPVPQTPSVCATDEKYTFVDDEDALSEHVRVYGHCAPSPPIAAAIATDVTAGICRAEQS